MKVFIISVEHKESPRLKIFLNQSFFQDKAIHYEIIGIKGADLPTKEYFEMAVKGREKPLTPGELGCTLSHLEALKRFLNSKEDYALILEDDAIIPDDLNEDIIYKTVKSINLPANILFSLGGIQMKVCRNVRGKIQPYTFLNQSILKVSPHFYNRVNYTVAYIVDRVMAETLLHYHEPIRRADDWSYLHDFDSTSQILMTHLFDHPIVEKYGDNKGVSLIQHERDCSADLKTSNFGGFLSKNLAKIFNHKYK
ncbi:glycosyltransferase family 25 protein [Acinetobacter sp. YH12142]|uniref:glycosyltransferase family 25 protein n=1 Tax=Acinetobacter sp. YH12142 TaxID=2601126 RepID=UPI0015D45DE5|nr:glycosyltransferase family 25 protein [Acinetobacter sp. YH12142]